MRCDDDACACMCHVDPSTHVPVCPRHSMPLQPSEREAGHGYCPDCFARNRHAHWPADTWAWLHKANLSADDYPPGNGYKPVPIPEDRL